MIDLQSLARALGGEVHGEEILAPGPGHSAADRSLSVKLDANAPDGFVVHSFAGDDDIECKDYVREKAGLGPFKANSKRTRRSDQPKRRVVKTYDYADENGQVLYQVVRYEPKDFRQRRPDGSGGCTAYISPRSTGAPSPRSYPAWLDARPYRPIARERAYQNS